MPATGTNIVALDQENHGLVAVINGSDPRPFDPSVDIGLLPVGGGVVVADANAWAVRNPLSLSQYCWDTADELEMFLRRLRDAGYEAQSIPNPLARRLYVRSGHAQADAVVALAEHVHDRVADQLETGSLWCGRCDEHVSFTGGRPVRRGRTETVDRSFGQRDLVKVDFLTLQNDLRYDTPFVDEAVAVVWEGTTRAQRDLLNLKKTICEPKNPNRVAAIAACTHNPWTGELRTHDGVPWGRRFIRRRVIGLNGTMCGTGPGTAGNPMRAVLRSLGRGKTPAVLNDIDGAVTAAIWALQRHGDLPAA
jgi:hypothetical protein